MTDSTEDVFKTMNSSRVLVAILNKIGSIEIPTEDFVKASSEDAQLSVTYNNETLSFEFKIEDKGTDSNLEVISD
jgi:hypothetical protein